MTSFNHKCISLQRNHGCYWWGIYREKIILKRRLKAKTVFMINPDSSNGKISNYIKIIDKQHARLHPPRGLQKSLIKEKWIVIGKVIYSRRNYCKIKEGCRTECEIIIMFLNKS